MDSKKLEILISSLDAGSFIKASEIVGYTQSGITHMMDSLEREIGIKIISRNHNGITLSKEGEILLPFIKDFLKTNAKLENKIDELKNNSKKVIRVSTYASIAMNWIPEILYRYKRICPDVNVELTMVDNALEPFELLEDDKADVIFASKHDGYNCKWIDLYSEQLYAIVPKNYPLKNKKIFPIKKFKGTDFLMPYGRFDIKVNETFNLENINANITTPKVDDETLIRMVSKGLGISLMSELMIRGRTDDVLCIPISPSNNRILGLGIQKNSKDKTIEKLIECVKEYINDFNKK